MRACRNVHIVGKLYPSNCTPCFKEWQQDYQCTSSIPLLSYGSPKGTGNRSLVTLAVDTAKLMVEGQVPDRKIARGGRKAHKLEVEAQI